MMKKWNMNNLKLTKPGLLLLSKEVSFLSVGRKVLQSTTEGISAGDTVCLFPHISCAEIPEGLLTFGEQVYGVYSDSEVSS